MTPSAERFSRIPSLQWQPIMSAISSDPTLLSEETGDALMVEAFSQGMKGTREGDKRAKECVEKALVGQYCRSLGRDGVMLFFQRCVRAPSLPSFLCLPPFAKARTEGETLVDEVPDAHLLPPLAG